MIVLRIPANGEPHVSLIKNTLEDLQGCVGGLLECCGLPEMESRGIELLCNEEGFLKCLEPNVNLFPFYFVGDLVAVGVKDDEFISITADQYDFMMTFLEGLHNESK